MSTNASLRSDRVANAIKQREQIIEQITSISNFKDFFNFFENYKSRVSRINDRENSIFLRALVHRLNERDFDNVHKLSTQNRVEILETLINNSHLFIKGSSQYHVPLELSEKYYMNFEKREVIHSLINMCRVQVMGSDHEKESSLIEEDERHSSSQAVAVCHIYNNLMVALMQREGDFDRLIHSLNDNVDMIGRCFTFFQRKKFLQRYVISHFIEVIFGKFVDDRGHFKDLLRFEEAICDPQFSSSKSIQNIRKQRLRYIKNNL